MEPNEEKAALVLEIKELATKIVDEKALPKDALTDLKAKVKELEEKAKEITEPADYKDVKSEVERLATELKAAKESFVDNKKDYKSIADQIREQIKSSPEKWEDFKSGGSKSFGLKLDIKAPGTMLTSTNLSGSNYLPVREIVPGFVDLVRNRPFLEQFANTSGTNSANIVWVNKTNKQGNATFVSEGALKPLASFDFETENSVAGKVAEYMKVSREMLDDIEFMAAAIENELRYEVDIAVDVALLTGTGIAPQIPGITTFASAYVTIGIQTPFAQDADAIRAGIAQLASLNSQATNVFVNPIDAANIDLSKSEDGVYLIPPFTTADGRIIAGVKLFETNQIPVGYVLIADMTKFVVRNYKPFEVFYGWENDDFRRNLVSIIGERRLHAYASENNTGAFLYDTFDNIKTAITLP